MTDKRRWFQFRIGTVLLWMAIVAMAVGWWADRQRLRRESLVREQLRTESQEKDAKIKELWAMSEARLSQILDLEMSVALSRKTSVKSGSK